MLGRLKPGVTIGQAQAETSILAPKLYFSPKFARSQGVYASTKLTGLKEYVSGKLRRSLVVLWCAVGMILLIVCVNLANLLLARTAARSKEFAMRAALGAGRWRLAGQLLSGELCAGGRGRIAGAGNRLCDGALSGASGIHCTPLLSSVRIDGAALGWTLLITAVSAVMFGLFPGLKMSGKDLQSSLKDMGHGMSAGRSHNRVRAALVISEVALACVLLISAGLLLRSFLRVLDVDLGFQPSQASAIQVDLNDKMNQAQVTARFQEVVEEVKTIPGIQQVGISDNLPLEGNRSWGCRPRGNNIARASCPDAFVYIVTPGYLERWECDCVKRTEFFLAGRRQKYAGDDHQ